MLSHTYTHTYIHTHPIIHAYLPFVNAHIEEMLKSDHAVWWSPGGGNLLYVEFSDIRVPIYSFPWYGPEEDQYPEITHIAYPKVSVDGTNAYVLPICGRYT